MRTARLYIKAAVKLVVAAVMHPNTDHVVRFYADHVEVAPVAH